jgi:hypothetical protein
VAAVYETDTFNSFLKDALHPGGLALTRRVAESAAIGEDDSVLDIACGKGGTSVLLAREYGCRVIGIDLSPKMIALARHRPETLNGSVEFMLADAEELPFMEAAFDAIISECSFSILPNKEQAASEMSRVLKPSGRLVVTDVTLGREAPDGCHRGLNAAEFPLVPCMAGARSVEDYVAIFEGVGFHDPRIEDHTVSLRKIGYQIGIDFGDWEGFLRRLSSELCSGSAAIAPSVEQYQRLFTAGKFGYALIALKKRC